MPVSRCHVSYTDPEGIAHTVEVEAESLYEAVALAVSEFREDLAYVIARLAPQRLRESLKRWPENHRRTAATH